MAHPVNDFRTYGEFGMSKGYRTHDRVTSYSIRQKQNILFSFVLF